MLAYINKDGTVCPLAYIGLHFAYIRFRPVLENRLFPTVAVYCPAAMNKTHISSHEKKKLMNYSSRTIPSLETLRRSYICPCPPQWYRTSQLLFFPSALSQAKVRCSIVSANWTPTISLCASNPRSSHAYMCFRIRLELDRL